MDVHNRLPVIRFHLQKAFISEDAGVVNQDIHPTESVQGRLDYILTALGGSHIIVICHCCATLPLDFRNDIISG